LKIAEIEVITLLYRYPEGKGFWYAGGYCSGRLSSLVKVRTDNGLSGIGSVYSHPTIVRTIIEEHLQDMLVGADPLETERLWDLAYSVTRWYGRKGAAVSALGGVDTALWDIRGKAAGKPIYKLLSAERDSVPAYASALLWREDPTQLGDEAGRLLDEGFQAMKMRLGRNFDYDCAALHVVRDTIGKENRLMIEGNARYSLEQAERMGRQFQNRCVYWFEEPFPPEDTDDYLALRAKVDVPLAAGENEFGVQGFRELLDRKMVDIVQPDCSRAGGITECRRIGQLAAQRGLRVATHTWSDAIALVSNMHVIASLSNGATVEIDRTGNGLIDDLLAEPLKVAEGKVALPKSPGLGIELDDEAVKRYTLPRGAPVPDGNYSDMVFGGGYWTPAEPYESVKAES